MEKEFCEYPDCYNTKTNNKFCIEHKNEIWFESKITSVWRGDELVGEISQSGAFELFTNKMHASIIKEIVDAVYSKMSFLLAPKFLYEMSNLTEYNEETGRFEKVG